MASNDETRVHEAAGGAGAPFALVDGASLAALRIGLGLLLVAAIVRYFAHGWIHAQYVEPSLFFPWPGLEWIRPWPAWGMYAHFAALGVLAFLVAVGWRTRLSALLFGLGFTWVHLIDRSNYLNHYYLVSLLCALLVALPTDRVWALDARRRSGPGLVPAWTVWLVRFQVGVVYVFAGIAKLDADWLLEAQPLRIWLGSAAGAMPWAAPVLARVETAYLFSWCGAAFDLAAPLLLLWPRTRAAGVLLVVAFHLATAALFPIGLFPFVMVVVASVFLAPDWPRRAVALVRRGAGTGPAWPVPGTRPAPAGLAVGVALVGLYVLAQVALPLRHLAYPGDVRWTEEGFRFSWMVMRIEKRARARFVVRDPRTGRSWRVEGTEHLTPFQERMMSTQPDMVLAFAHHLRDLWAARGIEGVEVRADVMASLNGAPARRLIDPDVDLARERDGLVAKRWILSRGGGS